MKRKLTYLVLIILVSTLGLWHSDASAQGGIGQWIFDTTINPDSTPLEISGGGVFPDLDTFIVLDQMDLANLQVYNINRNTRSVESTSTIPVNTPAFGLGHVIRSANDTAHSCFVDDSQHRLYATHSQNAVDWDKLLVTNDTNFSSCDTAVENGNVFVGACNFGADEYRVYQSADNGQTWNLIETIDNVLCAFEGGTRANFNRIDGESVIFYMTGFNGGTVAANDQSNTTRLVAEGELVLAKGGNKTVFGMDDLGPPLAESYPSKKIGGFTVTPFYHRASNTISLSVAPPPPFTLPIIVELGPAPLFTSFFGLACAEGPEGIVNVIAPGRHFQYDPARMALTQVTPGPLGGLTDGPVAACRPIFDDPNDNTNDIGFLIFSSTFRGNSFDYAQFGLVKARPIPTLSEWGLIAMAGVLGIIGLLAIRRRKATA